MTGYHAQSDYDPYLEPEPDWQAEAYTVAHQDYLAAREALRRITPSMPPAEVFALQDRFYRAHVALQAFHELEQLEAINAQIPDLPKAEPR